jgi:hypothetical protein
MSAKVEIVPTYNGAFVWRLWYRVDDNRPWQVIAETDGTWSTPQLAKTDYQEFVEELRQAGCLAILPLDGHESPQD